MILPLILACAADAPEPKEGPVAPAPVAAPAPAAAPAPVALAPCVAEAESVDVGRRVEVQLFVDRGVAADRAGPLVEGAVSWWGAQGVELVVNGPVAVDLKAALGGSRAELDAAFAARGIDPGKPLEPGQKAQMIEAVSDVVLGSTRAWLMTRAVPVRDGGVDVVLVPRIAAPDSPVDRAFTRMDGLTLRADLALRKDAMGTLVDQLGIDAFTPTVFVAIEGLDARPPGGWEGTLTHEIGHALGLEHVTDPHNLMVEAPPDCVPGLSAEQVDQLRAD